MTKTETKTMTKKNNPKKQKTRKCRLKHFGQLETRNWDSNTAKNFVDNTDIKRKRITDLFFKKSLVGCVCIVVLFEANKSIIKKKSLRKSVERRWTTGEKEERKRREGRKKKEKDGRKKREAYGGNK